MKSTELSSKVVSVAVPLIEWSFLYLNNSFIALFRISLLGSTQYTALPLSNSNLENFPVPEPMSAITD